MIDKKGLFKTGALAVAVTIAFGLVAYKAAGWFGSETVTNGCTTGGFAKVIPQIAVGSLDGGMTTYSTVIQIVNTSGDANSISANFYKEDGSVLNNVTLTAGTSNLTTGVLPAAAIAKDAVYVISGGGSAAAGSVGWGKITSCGDLSISTFYELRDGVTNALNSRVGVAASAANMSSFVIPRVRDVASGLDVAFAVVNTGAVSAELTATLKDAGGNTLAARAVTMGAGTHQALFTQQFFGLSNEPAGRSYQYITFTSAAASFAAIGLAFEGRSETSFPVAVLQ